MGYSGPISNAGGIDPSLMQSINSYILGASDYNPLGTQPSPIPRPFSFDEDEPMGSMENTNDYFTMQKKAMDLISDPAWRFLLGDQSGGYGPQQFGEQRYTYRPIQSKANDEILALQGGDAVDQLIHNVLNTPGMGRRDAIVELRDATTNPEFAKISDYNEQLQLDLQRLTGTPDGDGGFTYDFEKEVNKTYDKIQRSINSDEQLVAAGPDGARSYNPGFTDGEVEENNLIVRGNDGLLYEKIANEPTEAQQYAAEAGAPDPYQTYNPDDFADPASLAREIEALAEGDQLRQQYDVDMANWETEWSTEAMRARALEQVSEQNTDAYTENGQWIPNGRGGFERPAGVDFLRGELPSNGWNDVTIGEASDALGDSIESGVEFLARNLGSGNDRNKLTGGVSQGVVDKGIEAAMARMVGPSPDKAVEQAKFDSNPIYQAMQDQYAEKEKSKPRMAGMMTDSSTGRKMTMAESRSDTERRVRNNYVSNLKSAGFSPFEDWRRGQLNSLYGPGYAQAPTSMPGISQPRGYLDIQAERGQPAFGNDTSQGSAMRQAQMRHVLAGDPRDRRTWGR